MQLHLYGSIEQVLTTLRHQTLAWQTADSLSDSLLPFSHSINKAPEHITDEMFRNFMLGQYQQLPAHLRSAIAFEYFFEKNHDKRSHFEQQIRDQWQSSNVQFNSKVYERARLIRLFANGSSISLWHQLATNYNGAQLTLNMSANQIKVNGQYVLTQLEYHGDKLFKTPHPFSALQSRSPEFSEQKEWRLLALQSHDELVCHINKTAILGVTLGLNVPVEQRDALLQLMRTDQRYKHCQIKQLVVSPTRWALTAIPL